MDKSQIKDKIYFILQDYFGISLKKIEPSCNLIDDFGMDSLDTVEFIIKIEEQFDLEVSDEDAEKIKTVRDILDYVGKKFL